MSVRIEVKEGSTATIDGPAMLRVIGGTVEIDGVPSEFPRTQIADGEVAEVTGPAIITVRSDVPGSVLIDGEPVDPGAPVPDVAPVISSLSPNAGVCGDPADLTMIVTGTGYLTNSIIMFGGLDEPTVIVSDTELSTIVKQSLFLGPDAIPVCVRNGDALSNELTFTFTAASQRAKARSEGCRKRQSARQRKSLRPSPRSKRRRKRNDDA